MAHSYHHACSSAKSFGGKAEDYQEIHDFMDSSKAAFCDARHRAILHNSFGVFIAERVFGTTMTNSSGREIPVRLIAEQHIREDCGGLVPTIQDWLARLPLEKWMIDGAKKLSIDNSKEEKAAELTQEPEGEEGLRAAEVKIEGEGRQKIRRQVRRQISGHVPRPETMIDNETNKPNN